MYKYEIILDGIHHACSGVKNVVFLGFGFHKQNLDLIGNDRKNPVQIYSSGFGIPPQQINNLSLRILHKFYNSHNIKDLVFIESNVKCKEFFDLHCPNFSQ